LRRYKINNLITTKIEHSHDDYEKASKFAIKLWYAGKQKGDWRSTGTKRGLGKYITTHPMGKLAELGFAKFLKANWEINVELSFGIYPGNAGI